MIPKNKKNNNNNQGVFLELLVAAKNQLCIYLLATQWNNLKLNKSWLEVMFPMYPPKGCSLHGSNWRLKN